MNEPTKKPSKFNTTLELLDHVQGIRARAGTDVMYSYLSNYGYRYARLALGVFTANSLGGRVAITHMTRVAADAGVRLGEETISIIRERMATAYIDKLEEKFKEADDTDVRYDEAWEFHTSVFKSMGLPADCWTLNTPFELFEKAESEVVWERMLNSAGDPSAELAVGMDLLGRMNYISGKYNYIPNRLPRNAHLALLDTLFGIIRSGGKDRFREINQRRAATRWVAHNIFSVENAISFFEQIEPAAIQLWILMSDSTKGRYGDFSGWIIALRPYLKRNSTVVTAMSSPPDEVLSDTENRIFALISLHIADFPSAEKMAA